MPEGFVLVSLFLFSLFLYQNVYFVGVILQLCVETLCSLLDEEFLEMSYDRQLWFFFPTGTMPYFYVIVVFFLLFFFLEFVHLVPAMIMDMLSLIEIYVEGPCVVLYSFAFWVLD